MTIVRTYEIPGLATVSLDTSDNYRPALEIRLSPDYHGDLNDIAEKTAGPADIYLRCNHASALNNPQLAKFMETMTHWDHTGDGIPDCDEIIDAIEEALWQTRDKPEVFHRPRDGWYTKLVMSIMPPAPSRHIVLSFGKLQPRFRWYHHAAALPMLLIMIALIQLQIHYLPWTSYSVVSGFMAGAKKAGLAWWLALIIFVIGLQIFRRRSKSSPTSSLSQHTYGFFNKAAVFEEQAFREGSEGWTSWQRVRSCLAFGAIHMINLIYPLATIVPLALGGGLLMFIYLRTYRKTRFRRTAVLTASVWHRVYNRLALIALVVSLTAVLGMKVIAIFAVFAVLLVATTVHSQLGSRKARHAAPSSVTLKKAVVVK